MLKSARANFIMQRLGELYPDPPIPLEHKTLFELLVAVLLSAQCTDKRVNLVTPLLFSEAQTAFEMQYMPLDKIYEIIRPCGLAPKKSAAILKLSKILVDQYDGVVPEDIEKLEELKTKDNRFETLDFSTLATNNGFIQLRTQVEKMSKSKYNVVNPDDVCNEYGADTLRLYEMFMGPLRETKLWRTKGVEGCSRFLARSYRLFDSCTDQPPTDEQLRTVHKCIAKVTEETENLRFNTAIAAMMEFTNAATKWEQRPKAVLRPFVLLLSPYAPHVSEELWERLGNQASNAYEAWPVADPTYLKQDTFTLAVQVNGKMRGKIELSADAQKEEAVAAALGNEKISKFLPLETSIKKVIL